MASRELNQQLIAGKVQSKRVAQWYFDCLCPQIMCAILMNKCHFLNFRENVWTAIGPSVQSNIWSQIDPQHHKNSELFTDLSIKAEVQPCSLKSYQLDKVYCKLMHLRWIHLWFSISIVSQLGARTTNLWSRNAYRFLNCEWSPEAEKLKQHGVTSTFSSWTLVDLGGSQPLSVSCCCPSPKMDGKQGHFFI